jgi:nucleoside-diphosphate-sugar epimerase
VTNDNDATEQETSDAEQLRVFITSGESAAGLKAIRLVVAAGGHAIAIANDRAGADTIRQNGGFPAIIDATRAGEIAGMIKMAKASVVLHFLPQLLNGVPLQKSGLDADLLLSSTNAAISAAKSAGASYFVHTSCAFLYGDAHGEIVDETAHVTDSHDPLVLAALKAEKLVRESGIPYCILRAGYCLDYQSPQLIALSQALLKGRAIACGDAHNLAGFIHADDLAAAAMLTVEKRPNGEIFNIVGDSPASLHDFAAYMSNALGVGEPSWKSGFITQLTTDKTIQELISFSAKPANAKAKDQLGWEPKYKTYQDGVEQAMLAWRATMTVES